MEPLLNHTADYGIDDGRHLSAEVRKRGFTSDDILRLLVYSPLENKSFVPNGALDEVITFDIVASTLAALGLELGEQSQLARDILEKGRRIFAILLFINQVSDIKTLFSEGFTDEMLPVAYQAEGDSWKVRSYQPNSDNLEKDKVWVFFQRWKKSSIFSFCERQWMFLSPVFRKEQFKYLLHRDAILPFVSAKGQTKQSYFSVVFHVEVHAAHHRFPQAIDRPLSCAVKELAAPDCENTFEKESNALACMREIDHKHLIKCIAAVQKEQRYFFIFPWADGGNLREFWASHDSTSPNPVTMSWAIAQMRGLADALTELHNCNTRHGDLKPENILRFSDHTSPGHGRLVIADVGLAKVHTNTTRSRQFPTRTVTGTARYEAPEAFLPGQSRSRVYDVWALGCIILEFATWILQGWEFLQKLNSSFESYAHVASNGTSPVDPVVQDWMERMLRDPRCSRNTALGEIVDFAKHRLLVPIQNQGDAPLRASAKELYAHLSAISNQYSDQSTYPLDPDTWETFRRNNTSTFNLGISFSLPSTNSSGLGLPLRNRRVPSPKLVAMSRKASLILGESLTEEPTAMEIDLNATARPTNDSSTPSHRLRAPRLRVQLPSEVSYHNVQDHMHECSKEKEINNKSTRSTIGDVSSNDSAWSVNSGNSYESVSSISENMVESTPQENRVFENLVKNKEECIADKTNAWVSSLLDSEPTLAAHQHGETSAAGGPPSGTGQLVNDNNNTGLSAHKKRKGTSDGNKDDEMEGEDDSEDDERREKGKKKPRTSARRNQRLACPFFKYDPELYGNKMTCRGHSWDTVHRIKEHLFRKHTQPEGRCHRCLEEFKSVASLQQHQRKPVPCDIVENTKGETYIDAQTVLKLRRKQAKGSLPKKSESVKWKEMFILLFPQVEPVPSPYFDDIQEKRSELEVIQDFSSFAAREFLAEMDAVLIESGIEDALRARLVKKFQSSQPMIQERYLQKQRKCRSMATQQEDEASAGNRTTINVEERSHHGEPPVESGKQDDTRNKGGGMTHDALLNQAPKHSDANASRQFSDERLIPNLLVNLEASEFSQINPVLSGNVEYHTAPPTLQSTESYQLYGAGQNNIVPQNMSDNAVNYWNMPSSVGSAYENRDTSSNTPMLGPLWTSFGQEHLASNSQSSELTPVALSLPGAISPGHMDPSYSLWQQPRTVGVAHMANQSPITHSNHPNVTGNRSRTRQPNHLQEATSGPTQPSYDHDSNAAFYDSGYLTMRPRTGGDAEGASLWGHPAEDGERQYTPR
ncbi:hypothetical protein F5Y14DRAFT_465670 [Nemania sp. NC0429]|nr:hypothetical protein F5Y14DRAFT_465670 [Nemania sp. NC0429]